MTETGEPPHVLLSGPLSVGKTTLARRLATEHGYRVVSARAALRRIAEKPLKTREALQEFGAELEAETEGEWIVDVLRRELEAGSRSLVVDALRTPRQVAAARVALTPETLHVHLVAQPRELATRFNRRAEPDIVETSRLQDALRSNIEHTPESLARNADAVIDTTGRSPSAVYEAARELLLGTLNR